MPPTRRPAVTAAPTGGRGRGLVPISARRSPPRSTAKVIGPADKLQQERRRRLEKERLEQERWELDLEKKEVAHRQLNQALWEKNQAEEKREKAERELNAMTQKVEKLERKLKRKGAWIPGTMKELREKAVSAIVVYTTRHADMRSRDEDAIRRGRRTRAEKGGLYRPSMTPVERKAKVEKEVKDSQYSLDIASARLMLRPQACTDQRLTIARRALHGCLATIDSDPEDADQSDDTVRASKLLRLLESREDPASIHLESEESSESTASESEEDSSDSSSTESRVGEKRKKKGARRCGSKKKRV